jgi:cell division protein FtsB
MRLKLCLLVIVFSQLAQAQLAQAQASGQTQAAALQAILQRLDSLEQQNRELVQEVHSLRQELITSHVQPAKAVDPTPTESQPSVDERVARSESRIEEQAQTKVESSHKFPIAITGMFLFNAFSNSRSQGLDNGYSDLLTGPERSGATLRQTLLGVEFHGPRIPGNGTVHGDLTMDFFGGSSYSNSSWLRIRRGVITLDWPNRSLTVGQDKPLISPRSPSSLAEVGVPPLAGAGNLWTWLPQVRYEERIHFGEASGITPQIALMQTGENYASVQAEYSKTLEQSRPGVEGRLAFWHKWDDTRRIEIAPGFHASTTHVVGQSVDSRLVSVDWLFRPWSKMEFSGDFFHGRNFSNLGALPQAFTLLPSDRVIPVHGDGGWVQLSSPITNRLTLNLFGGEQQNRARDLMPGDIQRNLSYAANLMYRLGPNVLVGIEALQLRTRLAPSADQLRNHYDLSFAYLF